MTRSKWFNANIDRISSRLSQPSWLPGLLLVFLAFFLLFELRGSYLLYLTKQSAAAVESKIEGSWSSPDAAVWGYTPEELRRVNDRWGEPGKVWYVLSQVVLDLPFPLLLGAIFVSFAAHLNKRFGHPNKLLLPSRDSWIARLALLSRSRLLSTVSVLSAVAIIFDYAENGLLILTFGMGWFGPWVKVVSLVTVVKWMAYLSVLVVIALAAGIWLIRLLAGAFYDCSRLVRVLEGISTGVRLRFPAIALILLVSWSYAATRIDALRPLASNALLLGGYWQVGLLAAINALAIIFCIAIWRALHFRLEMEAGTEVPHSGAGPWRCKEYAMVVVTASVTPLYALQLSLHHQMFEDIEPSVEAYGIGGLVVVAATLLAIALMWMLGWINGWLIGHEKGKSNFFPGEDRQQLSRMWQLEDPRSHFNFQMWLYFIPLVFFYLFVLSLLPLTQEWITVPAYAVMLIWLVTMALSAIGAWLDRTRIPIFGVLMLWIVIVRIIFPAPYSLRLLPAPSAATSSAIDLERILNVEANLLKADITDEVIAEASRQLDVSRQAIEDASWAAVTARMKRASDGASNEKRTLVIVTCPGGGIHAAAWTAYVLESLDRRYENFSDSIGFISSVSGGSVGSLYFASALSERVAAEQKLVLAQGAEESSAGTSDASSLPINEALDNTALDGNQWKRAAESSLEAISKGMATHDVPGAVLPIFFGADRGMLLEQSWEQRLAGSAVPPTLHHWERMAAAGELPIIAMNATDAASGRRIIFSTLVLPRRASLAGRMGRPWDIRELLKNPLQDIHMATAARASATFPYVSPFTRPDPANAIGASVAIGDGGYADNEGLVTAVDWLDFINRTAAKKKSMEEVVPFNRILLLRIQPGNDLEDPLRQPSPFSALQEHSRWFAGPLEALASIRTSSQVERGQLESDLSTTYIDVPWWIDGPATTPSATVNSPPPMTALTFDNVQLEKLASDLQLSRSVESMLRSEKVKLSQLDFVKQATNEDYQVAAINVGNNATDSGTDEPMVAIRPVEVVTIPFYPIEPDEPIPLNWKLSNRQMAWYPLSWQSLVKSATQQAATSQSGTTQQPNWLQTLDSIFVLRAVSTDVAPVPSNASGE